MGVDLGAAYGTAKSGVGIASMGVLKPELIFKSIVPIIMAGILGIYGLIISVILSSKSKLVFITSSSLQALLWLQRVSTLGLWSLLRSLFLRSWTCHWNCRRCWSQSQRTARTNFRGNDLDPHFRRSPRIVRSHYRYHPRQLTPLHKQFKSKPNTNQLYPGFWGFGGSWCCCMVTRAWNKK